MAGTKLLSPSCWRCGLHVTCAAQDLYAGISQLMESSFKHMAVGTSELLSRVMSTCIFGPAACRICISGDEDGEGSGPMKQLSFLSDNRYVERVTIRSTKYEV